MLQSFETLCDSWSEWNVAVQKKIKTCITWRRWGCRVAGQGLLWTSPHKNQWAGRWARAWKGKKSIWEKQMRYNEKSYAPLLPFYYQVTKIDGGQDILRFLILQDQEFDFGRGDFLKVPHFCETWKTVWPESKVAFCTILSSSVLTNILLSSQPQKWKMKMWNV